MAVTVEVNEEEPRKIKDHRAKSWTVDYGTGNLITLNAKEEALAEFQKNYWKVVYFGD